MKPTKGSEGIMDPSRRHWPPVIKVDLDLSPFKSDRLRFVVHFCYPLAPSPKTLQDDVYVGLTRLALALRANGCP